MSKRLPVRFWCQCAAAITCGVLLLLTLAEPQWIEVLFGVAPDGGSGEAEWGVVLGLALATAITAGLSIQTWRKAAHDHGQ